MLISSHIHQNVTYGAGLNDFGCGAYTQYYIHEHVPIFVYPKVASSNASCFVTRLIHNHTQSDNFSK